MELYLNGNDLTDRQLLYDEIQRQLPLPAHCGRNLDALWDVLSLWSQPLVITVENSDTLTAHLGQYGHSFLRLLHDVTAVNGAVTVVILEP